MFQTTPQVSTWAKYVVLSSCDDKIEIKQEGFCGPKSSIQ